MAASERDVVAGVARQEFLHWYGDLDDGQTLEQRVSPEVDDDGTWLCEFFVNDPDGGYGWWGYTVERDGDRWHCDQLYEGDALLNEADTWEPPAEGPAYAAERAAATNDEHS